MQHQPGVWIRPDLLGHDLAPVHKGAEPALLHNQTKRIGLLLGCRQRWVDGDGPPLVTDRRVQLILACRIVAQNRLRAIRSGLVPLATPEASSRRLPRNRLAGECARCTLMSVVVARVVGTELPWDIAQAPGPPTRRFGASQSGPPSGAPYEDEWRPAAAVAASTSACFLRSPGRVATSHSPLIVSSWFIDCSKAAILHLSQFGGRLASKAGQPSVPWTAIRKSASGFRT